MNARPALWLDFYDYAATLLENGSVPWLDQARFSAFHGRAQALLKSGVVHLPVEPIADALLAANPALVDAMRAKSRTGYPLRRLLEEPALREAVARLLEPLRAANADRPLALMVPSPRRWLALAYRAARGQALAAEVAGNGDEIGAAAVYVADFLRAFADCGLDAVVLVESPGQAPASAQELSWYDPVINKAHHYRWEVGLLDASPQEPVSAGGVDFHIAPTLPEGMAGGIMLGPDFWMGTRPPAPGAGCFHYAVVPAAAVPETVLQRLTEMA